MEDEASKRAFEQFKINSSSYTNPLNFRLKKNHFLYIMMHLGKQWGAHCSNWTKMGMTMPFILLGGN
jgi:hypothetical protein